MEETYQQYADQRPDYADRRKSVGHAHGKDDPSIGLTGWNWFDRLIYLMLALSYGTTAGVIVYLLGGWLDA